MKIQKVLWQERKDFTAIFKCEHCGDTVKGNGVVSAAFLKKALPDMTCEKCGKMGEPLPKQKRKRKKK